MSVQTEIGRLSGAKSAIAAAIADKGVDVPVGTKLDGMAALIAAIEAGGGGVKYTSAKFTPASDIEIALGYTFNYEFGFVPIAIVFVELNTTLSTKRIKIHVQYNDEILFGGTAGWFRYASCFAKSSSSILQNSGGFDSTPTENSILLKSAIYSSTKPTFSAGVTYNWFAFGV